MSSEVVIRAGGLGKSYELFNGPRDRIKQLIFGARRRYFREFRALQGVSFEVRKGEILGVMGGNGAGKSTLLQLVCGIQTPTTGSVEVSGVMSALLGLGADFNPEATGRENVFLSAAARGLSRAETQERFKSIADFAAIGEFIDRPVSTYSAGMCVRLAFATAFSLKPDILIVDEVLVVGDEAFQRKCFLNIAMIRRGGGTILMVTHQSHLVGQLCDRALLLDAGELLMIGPPRQIVPRYHQLLSARPSELPNVRAELLRLGRVGMGPASVRRPASPSADAPFFDPYLTSDSFFSEEQPRGARIEDPRIETLEGERVNVLIGSQEYIFSFLASFSEPASSVRCHANVSTITAFILAVCGGDEAVIPAVAAGTTLRARLRFRCNLGPGIYFLSAVILGVVDFSETPLHHINDAAAFRVIPGKIVGSVGIVDMQFRMTVESDVGHTPASAGPSAAPSRSPGSP